MEQGLAQLPDRHQLAFSAACCERSFAFYELFSEREDWGNPHLLREALDEIWKSLERSFEDDCRLRNLIAECEEVVPDSDDFPSDLATAAQEASLALLITLEQARTPDLRTSRRVAAFLRDTQDLYVQTLRQLDPNDPDLEQRIADDPLMKAELGKQMEDVEWLAKHPELTQAFLCRFRQAARDTSGLSKELLLQVDSR